MQRLRAAHELQEQELAAGGGYEVGADTAKEPVGLAVPKRAPVADLVGEGQARIGTLRPDMTHTPRTCDRGFRIAPGGG